MKIDEEYRREALKGIDKNFTHIKRLLGEIQDTAHKDHDLHIIGVCVAKIVCSFFHDLSFYFNSYQLEKCGDPIKYFEKFYKRRFTDENKNQSH